MQVMNNFSHKPRRKKKLGQVFLSYPRTIIKVVESVKLRKNDNVLEIGAGDGRVRAVLAERVNRLFLVEIDPAYVNVLERRFASDPAVTIIAGDILAEKTTQRVRKLLGRRKLVVYGSIPYYITSPILKWSIENRDMISLASFLIQKEVAQRVVAPPNSKICGYLSVFMQLNADVRTGPAVSRKEFTPVPKVDSQVLHVDFSDETKRIADERFLAFLSTLFQHRRKQLGNSIRGFLEGTIPAETRLELEQKKYALTDRPEQLSPARLLELYEMISRSK